MNKQLTVKQKADKLIDFLGHIYECSDGCENLHGHWNLAKIGDVLEKIPNNKEIVSYGLMSEQLHKWRVYGYTIQDLWRPLGFTKPLNEIFSGEIVKDCHCDEEHHCGMCYEIGKTYKFKDQNAQKLLDFLWNLFGKQILANQDK